MLGCPRPSVNKEGRRRPLVLPPLLFLQECLEELRETPLVAPCIDNRPTVRTEAWAGPVAALRDERLHNPGVRSYLDNPERWRIHSLVPRCDQCHELLATTV